jgi:hypothetical protein
MAGVAGGLLSLGFVVPQIIVNVGSTGLALANLDELKAILK